MIIRVVKMQLRAEAVSEFLSFFEARKQTIRSFDGSLHLELWQDNSDSTILFTYSHWESEAHLDNYRQSAFFRETWTFTKSLFAAKAEAWSLQSISVA